VVVGIESSVCLHLQVTKMLGPWLMTLKFGLRNLELISKIGTGAVNQN
jgi:hypothetical protein